MPATVTAVPLADNDLMPFGPYKDHKMQDVPAAYLDRLRDANWLHKWPRVEAYIEANAKVIDRELADADRRSDRRD